MPQMINRSNFPDFNNNLLIVWLKRFEAFPKAAQQIYDVRDVDVDTGDVSSMAGFSMAKYKNEGEDGAYLNIAQDYRKTWLVQEAFGMTKITWRMRRAAKYDEIEQSINAIADAVAKRMEIDMTHRLSFANATSYTSYEGLTITTTTGDGLALLSTAHTVTGSSTTYRNRVANNPILSKGGLEAAEKLFATQMIDANGELVFQDPTHLIVTNDPNAVNTAVEYLRSYADPTGANAGVTNVYEGKYQLLKLPYLSTLANGTYDSTKAKYWFLFNSNRKGGIVRVLRQPTFISPSEGQGMEFETMDWKYAGHAAYAIEWVDPRCIVGSLGDGTA